MAVLLGINRLVPQLVAEARAACKATGLNAVEWTGGIPRTASIALISGLATGERRIPDELLALLEAAPAMRLVLCAQEPLVKPRVVMAGGRVTILSPPIDSTQLVAALRAALEPEPVAPVEPRDDRRFEVLRRTHWVAWSRGRAGPPISLHEQRGATVVIGELADRAAVADAMVSNRSDDQRESELGALGARGVAHLTPEASEWVVYWPEHRPLWICSRHRLPARWNAAGALATGKRRMMRMPAFPDDQLVAAWSRSDVRDDALAPIAQTVVEGGSETIAGLVSITERLGELTGLVMEVR